MTFVHRIALCLAVAAPVGCSPDVPDLNNIPITDLLENPTPSGINSAATGLLVGARRDLAPPNGYVAHLGVLGREAYNFDAADPRFITELLVAENLDPGSPAFGGNFWINPYRNLRNAQILKTALDAIPEVDFPTASKEGVRGFTKTIEAYDYLRLISTRDTNGAVILMSADFSMLDPIATKDAVYAHIVTLLDEAKVHLMAAGETFSFPLSSGFAGFDDPVNFLKFNRALLARVEAYRGNHAAVLTALSESFITGTEANPQLDLGVYHSFGDGSGDTLNGLNDPNILAHPSIVADAEMNGGMIDRRVAEKIRTVPERTVQGLTSDEGFTMYQSITAPIPIIRNEELILLRAEANIGLGMFPAATTDINFIRVHSGGLAPVAELTAENAIDELLKQRRYSLLMEGGHRWIDMRRFGRLDQLPLDLPTHHIHSAFPLPVAETDARE